MTSPPKVRASLQSMVIQGLRSSGRGLQPVPTNACVASNCGSALDALAVGLCKGVQSSILRSAIHTVPAPPSPATMANSSEPSCDKLLLPLAGPQANSMSRLSTLMRFHRVGSRKSFSTYRHTLRPVGSMSFSSRCIHPSPAPQPKMHGVLRRHGAAEPTASDDEALAALEVVLHSQSRCAPRQHC